MILLAAALLASAPMFEDFPPVGPGSVSPEIAGAPDGALWASWIEKEGESNAVRVARVKGGAWTDPVTVKSSASVVANDADIPQVAPLADGTVVVQWMERVAGEGMALFVARSKDGRTFAKPVPLGKPSKAERGFARFWSEAGSFRAAWLEDGKLLSAAYGAALPQSGARRPSDGDGAFGEATVVDEKVCECCQLAVAPIAGGGLIAYRDRAEDEVRDIKVITHAGIEWGDPVETGREGWKIPACPVNGPAIDVQKKDAVVAWFSGAGEDASVKVAFSKNQGKSFGDAIQVDAGKPEGKVAVRWIDATHALVTWVERTEDGNALWAAWAGSDGKTGEPAMIAAFRGGTSASHPRLARAGDEAWLAWSDGRGDARSPKLVRIAKLGKPDYTRVRGARERAAAQDAADAITALKEKRKGPAGAREGDPAPELEGVDLDGKKVTLAAFKGKVVLVTFWGTWCPPCRAEIPEQVEMREALHARGFEILSVNSGDSPKVARAYADEEGIQYPIVLDDGISQKWRVSGFPTNVIVDKKGVIRGRTQGYTASAVSQQRKLVETLLEEK